MAKINKQNICLVVTILALLGTSIGLLVAYLNLTKDGTLL